jgi:hypothetical protein
VKRFRLVVVAALLAVVASGCIKADLGMKVNEDGSGTFSALVAVNANFASSFGGLGGTSPGATTPGDFCKELLDDAKGDESLPDGAKVEPYKDGDFCGVRVSTPFKNLDEAIALLGSSSDSGSTGGGALSDLALEKTNNGFRFSANWDVDDASGDAGGDAFAQQFLKGFSYIVRIKLPGGQVENNADRIDGDGTMIWNLDPLKSTRLTARTELGKPVITNKVQTDAGKNVSATVGGGSGGGDDGGGSKTWLWIVLGLVVVAGVIAFVLLRKNKAKGAPPSPGLPGVPVGVGAPFGAPPAPMGAAPMSAPAPVAPAPVAPAPAPPAPAAPAPAPVAPAPVAPAPTQPAADATMVTGVDAPQWDAARNAYIQYDRAGGRWLQFDQAAQAWKPIE